MEKELFKRVKNDYKDTIKVNNEIIKSHKNSVKSTIKKIKDNKRDLIKKYKSERPPFKFRFIETVKLIVAKVKKIYEHLFRAWLLIVELKGEIIKLKDDIKSVVEATERHDTPVGFTLNRLRNIIE
ncbi:hypothetical protein LCGC14_1413270 [marine sediment metagenome]|uniref:Uncharacterized protein n=1 Tax=marine sediment metagenome TaxID=412755 RepID=A0A0F9JTK6_9ZZZZ